MKFPEYLNQAIIIILILGTLACGKDDNNPPGASGKILFDTNRDPEDNQGAEIYVTNEDGTQQTRLTNSSGFDTDAKWNSDGTKIVFSSIRDGSPFNIYIMNADGNNVMRLTDTLLGGTFPVFSPNNSKIAYNSSDGNSTSNAGIYLMNADGSNRQRLGSAFGDSDPDYSPDGNKIVFTSSRTGDNEIFIMNSDGSNQLRLTNETFTDFMPAWNPDGDKIVFVSFRGNEKAIYTMNPDGSNQTRIFLAPGSEQPNDPRFNPDGDKIVFSMQNRLQIINADGTGVTELPGSGFNSNPDWR
ncbi:MAG: DUF5050 domain-containing protein [Saprospiraceae bacterium]